MPFAGNAQGTSSLFSMEITLATWQSPLVADLYLEKLLELQPSMRSLILAEMSEITAAELRSVDRRTAFVSQLRDVLNTYLEKSGTRPDIEEVIITSFVIT
jgi:flagellar basal body-associated protein FliL